LNERSTEEQIRTFFSRKYVVFDAQQNSLQEAGVANSVQLQELLQATTDEFINVRDSASRQQEEQDRDKRLYYKWYSQRMMNMMVQLQPYQQ
jgi:hypothetical protein